MMFYSYLQLEDTGRTLKTIPNEKFQSEDIYLNSYIRQVLNYQSFIAEKRFTMLIKLRKYKNSFRKPVFVNFYI